MRVRASRPENIPENQRYCPSCQQVLPIKEFVRNRSTTSGIGSYCRPCQAKKSDESLKRVHGSARHYHLKRRYGLGADDVLAMLEAQDSACLVCRRQLTVGDSHVDHDHETGSVRGILCFGCNGGLGQFGDDPEVLVRAARYLLTAAREHVPADVVFLDALVEIDRHGPAA